MKNSSNQKMLIGSLAASALLASVATSMANVALPSISSDFGVSFSDVRWVVLGYLLASTLFSLGVGRLGDQRGRSKILLAGTVLFTAGTFLCGYSSSFWLLIFARIVQGIGGAALIVLPIAIVSELMPREKMGRVIGLLATMSAIGTASGPSLGGLILGEYGWRAAFFFMTALGGVSLFLLMNFTPPDRSAPASEARGESDFLGVMKSVCFDSLLRARLFANFVVSAILMATLIVGPFYLTQGLHLEPRLMGLVMSAGPIASIVFGIFSGYAVDRFGSLAVVRFGFIQLLIGAVSFVLAPSIFGALGFALSAVLLSLGYQLFLSANSSAIMTDVTNERRGLVSGALSLSRNLGLIAGTSAMGGVFALFADPSAGLQATFLVAAGLVALLLAFYPRRRG
jgi:MFS family permease